MTRNGYRGHLTLNRSPKDKVHTGYRQRFGVRQGGKIRPVDDFSQYLIRLGGH